MNLIRLRKPAIAAAERACIFVHKSLDVAPVLGFDAVF